MISVIVPVRNGMPWLEAQLQALADQQCAEEWELIIADNGSTDASPSVGQQWAERHANVRWIDASAVHGAPAARNVGVGMARGDLLAFCDADDIVRPGWLASCAKALDEVDVVAGVFDFWSLNGLQASPPKPASMRQLGFLPAGLGANLAVRRQAFESVGGFTEELKIGEDIDLCWRLQLQGSASSSTSAPWCPSANAPSLLRCSGRRPPTVGAARRSTAGTGPTGARRNLTGAAKSWLWLIVQSPRLARPGNRRTEWARAAGMRSGRLIGSLRERVFFP